MRILVRTSRWAIWSRRWASLAVPLVVIPIFMHREHAITSEVFQIVEVMAFAIACLALLSSIVAFVRLWHTGDRGWGYAVAGFCLALVCMAPAGAGLYFYLRTPHVTDVTTDTLRPPALLLAKSAGTASPEIVATLAKAFPNAHARFYALNSRQMFPILDKLVGERGWQVENAQAPTRRQPEGSINAVDTTWLGWRDEVALRVVDEGDGALVDMRSASLLAGPSDLGANGRRIEEFLGALDGAVTVLMRDNPNGVPEPEEAEPPTVDANGAPIPRDRPQGL